MIYAAQRMAQNEPSFETGRTKFDNTLMFAGYLITRSLRHRLHSLKRKRVFAEIQNPEVNVMKLVQSLIVAAALAIPAVSSFAQSSQPVSRAEVKAQLVQLEKAGYSPAGDNTTYPANIQAAQARFSTENAADAGYGGVAEGTSASGIHRLHGAFVSDVTRASHKVKESIRPNTNNGMKPVYFGS
jgi:uncharacterized membrane protein